MPRRVRCVGVLVLLAAALCLVAPAVSQEPAKSPATKNKAVSSFKSGDREITVWEWAPAQPGKHPAIVLLHGIDGLASVDPFLYSMLGKMVADRGYVVQVVHYMDSTRDKDLKPEQIAQLEAKIKNQLVGPGNDKEVRDLYERWMAVTKECIERMRRQDNVQGDKVALGGISLGGYLAMSVTVQNPELKLSAVVELFGGLPKAHQAMVKLPMPPVFIIHTKDDNVVPFRECEALMKVLGDAKAPFEREIYEKGGHAFIGPSGFIDFKLARHAEEMVGGFLAKHLKGEKKVWRQRIALGLGFTSALS